MPKVCIIPHFSSEDNGDGGIRRVVEAQRKWLPKFGWDVVDAPDEADLVATHAGNEENTPASVPLVAHCHGLYWSTYDWERWALQMNRRVIKSMRRADVVTAPSEWVACALRRGSQIDPVVLYHGVDLEDWPLGGSAGDNVPQYVLWNKTRPDAICDPEPMYELAKRVPEVRFITTVASMRGTSEPDNLKVIGVMPFKAGAAFVKNAYVYLATTRETFGIGTLEAMASGVPVLGWDWGGQREIVTHKVDGYLAKVDDYDDLVVGLQWCLENRAEAGSKGRAKVEMNFTWERAIQRYAELYERLYIESQADRPFVSVVIPAYNMESLLPDAVQSVIDQDGYESGEVEIVIVNDASTDGTGDYAHELDFQFPNLIKAIHNERNLYLAEALNVGISAARGRYIVPLDADNMLGPGSIRLLVSALERDRDIDIAYGAMEVIEEDGREWISGWPSQFEYRRQMKHQNQIPSTSMYRKRAWARVGGYRRRCRTAEDADFWCRATSFGANARKVTDAVVLRYRNRSDSMSHVQPDWAWHEWYPWGKDISLTPWIAPVGADENCVIPPYETPLVTVVIPVGPGHERLVLDALDSLNAQTFRWWEAVVVNDTGAPLPWVHPWARVVDSDRCASGAGAARNRGMDVAHGQYFLFLDADDYLQPHAIEYMFNASIRARGGFVYTDWFRQETAEAHQAPEWDGCSSVLRELPWSVTCLYPIEAWAATGGFDESLPAWEDWDFAIRVVQAGYCGTRVAVPLFHYRMGSGARREAGFADRENLKLEILNRWEPYIKGAKTMPCGCGGGGGLPSLPALDLSSGQPTFAITAEVSTEDMIQLEYLDEVSAPLTYTGRATGSHYRFGSDDDNKVRWVYRKDADHFITGGSFRVYADVAGNAPLMAAGPPR